MKDDLKNLRTDYGKHSLSEKDAGPNPFLLFDNWFNLALIEENVANAFILSTGLDQPTSRVVLLKELRDDIFVFFTNYASQKGQDIEENRNVSMLFFWQNMERQIHIKGVATKVSAEESDEYFYSRPVESQIGALTSLQSAILTSRSELENRFEELSLKHQKESIVRPSYWGGYEIKPSYFEFWQGRQNRLHDRIQFKLAAGEWKRNRLSP